MNPRRPLRIRHGLALVAVLGAVAALAWLALRGHEDVRPERARPAAAVERRARGVDPTSPGAADAEEGRRLMREGRVGEAIAALRRATSADPTEVMILDSLGAALLQSGDLLAARETLARAAALASEDPDVLLHAGLVAQRLGLLDEAERHLEAAVAAGPRTPQEAARVAAALGEVHVAASQRSQALDTQRLDEGIALFRAALERSDEPFIRRLLGSALQLRGDREGAAQQLEAAARADSRDVVARVALAQLALDARRLDVAERWLREALAVQPAHARALHLLGLVHVERGQDEEAVAALRRAADAAPGAADTRYQLAGALTRLGRDGEAAMARTEFERASRAEEALVDARRDARSAPDSAVAQYNLGVTLTRAGDLDEAALAYQRAVTLDPRLAAAHANLGLLRLRSGDTSGAAAELRRALELDPRDASARHGLARLHAKRGDVAAAITQLETLLADGPELDEAAVELAALLAGAGRWEEARSRLEAVVRRNPRHVAALHDLGGVYLHAGELAKAADAFERVLAIEPGNASARRHLDLARAARRD
jgi:tetratricopeptide (TPR) repeat protein